MKFLGGIFNRKKKSVLQSDVQAQTPQQAGETNPQEDLSRQPQINTSAATFQPQTNIDVQAQQKPAQSTTGPDLTPANPPEKTS